ELPGDRRVVELRGVHERRLARPPRSVHLRSRLQQKRHALGEAGGRWAVARPHERGLSVGASCDVEVVGVLRDQPAQLPRVLR
ncbi:MAG: hypothetical protein SGPRY_004247, partial [Prymnesium sp.]